MSRRGMTLLEVMVALVILGLVGGAFLELFGGAIRGASDASGWSQAVAYATDGMEHIKLDPAAGAAVLTAEQLPDGFERRVELRPWDDGLTRVSVIVTFPAGRGRYVLERLVRVQ